MALRVDCDLIILFRATVTVTGRAYVEPKGNRIDAGWETGINLNVKAGGQLKVYKTDLKVTKSGCLTQKIANEFLKDTLRNLKKFAADKKNAEQSIDRFIKALRQSKKFKKAMDKVKDALKKEAEKAAKEQKKKPVPKQ